MIQRIYPYLVMNGNGQDAVKFYQAALDAELISLQTFGDMPPNPEFPTPPEAKNLVLNAQLKVGETDLMLSDNFPGSPYQIGSNVTIALIVNTVEKAKEVFGKLEDGGNVSMPLQETFWSPAYGNVTDKFGINWQVSTETSENK
jgi:PhnB protein